MSKFVVMATWDDAPHLTAEQKRELWESIPPHQRDARAKGIPQLGAGAIYPIAEEEFIVEPFQLPDHWLHCYAMDVGWNRTAAIWGAYDREGDTVYLWSEHYQGQAEPAIHAQGIKSRGEWIPGVIDPAARGRSQADGTQLMSIYVGLGLNITPADNAVESGIFEVWQRLSTGRLKVFRTLHNFLSEFRIYRRDEKGKIIKERDHLMDCTRYIIKSGIYRAMTRFDGEWQPGDYDPDNASGRNSIGGY